MKEIVPGVIIESDYAGVTIGAVQTPNGVILIDAPLSPKDAQAWRSACSRASNSDRLLVLLDEHFDRCIGARSLRCPIIAHEKTSQAIIGRNTAPKPQTAPTGSLWESNSEVNSVHWVYPEITFTHEMNINWDEQEPLHLEHHPGPSRGSSWAVLPEKKVAFIGDTVITAQPPFLAAADLEMWDETLDLLKSSVYRDYILISGRGGMVTRDDVQNMQKFLKKAQRLADKNCKGKTDLVAVEEASVLLAEDFKARTKAEAELFHARLVYGFGQYCLNTIAKRAL